MTELSRILTNPAVRDKVTFLKTSAETKGAYVMVEVELAPGGGNRLHYHVDYKEIFSSYRRGFGCAMRENETDVESR